MFFTINQTFVTILSIVQNIISYFNRESSKQPHTAQWQIVVHASIEYWNKVIQHIVHKILLLFKQNYDKPSFSFLNFGGILRQNCSAFWKKYVLGLNLVSLRFALITPLRKLGSVLSLFGFKSRSEMLMMTCISISAHLLLQQNVSPTEF